MKKHKYIIIIFILILVSSIFSGCSVNRETKEITYYILDYIPHLDKEDLKQTKPFPYSVEITETQIPRTYQRNQIVEKNSINTISYSEGNIWADKLYNTIPQLLLQKSTRYNFFEDVQRDFFTSVPDFYIDSFVGNIERVKNNEYVSAHIKMDFYLRNAKQRIVVVHRFNKDVPVFDNDMSSVVQTFSKTISEEYDKFLTKTEDYFINGTENKSQIPVLNADLLDYSDLFEEIEGGNEGENTGELMVPNLSQSLNAPPVFIMNNETNYSSTIEMGKATTLPVGKYTLYLGEGQGNELTYPIEIKQKYRTIVEPNWSSLVVNIIDTGKSQVRMTYDIYESDNSEAIGFDLSAADEAGEENKVWILKPGSYFITIDGASFSSYIDFTTITLEANKHYNLTIVVDPDGTNGKLLGAGIHPQETDKLSQNYYSSTNAFHLNFNINADNEEKENSFAENITLSSQFDKKMYYERDKIDYEGRIDWELGFNKASESDLKISVDDFRFNNTLIYKFQNNGNFGVYGRVDAVSHFFPKHNYFASDSDYILFDSNGTVIDTLLSKERVKLQNPIFPLTLKEDLGLNYRVYNGEYGTLNLRAGLGWLQTYNKDVLVSGTDVGTFKTYHELSDTSTKGVATSVVSNIKINKIRLNWSSTADLLIPLQGEQDPTFEFINIFTIKLIRNVSWDFRFDVNYNENIKDYFVYDTSSFIRLSYFF